MAQPVADGDMFAEDEAGQRTLKADERSGIERYGTDAAKGYFVDAVPEAFIEMWGGKVLKHVGGKLLKGAAGKTISPLAGKVGERLAKNPGRLSQYIAGLTPAGKKALGEHSISSALGKVHGPKVATKWQEFLGTRQNVAPVSAEASKLAKIQGITKIGGPVEEGFEERISEFKEWLKGEDAGMLQAIAEGDIEKVRNQAIAETAMFSLMGIGGSVGGGVQGATSAELTPDRLERELWSDPRRAQLFAQLHPEAAADIADNKISDKALRAHGLEVPFGVRKKFGSNLKKALEERQTAVDTLTDRFPGEEEFIAELPTDVLNAMLEETRPEATQEELDKVNAILAKGYVAKDEFPGKTRRKRMENAVRLKQRLEQEIASAPIETQATD